MNNISRILLLSLTLTFLAACASTQRVQTDYNDDLDFGAYKTFNFAANTAIDIPDLAGDLELYFSAAVMRELYARGLVKSDDPDLLIDIFVEAEDVSRPPKRSNGCPRYEDYFGRLIDLRHGGLTGASRRPMCIYAEGQITVEMMDIARNQPYMEGIARVRLDDNDRGTYLQRSVAYDVATMFGKSPPRVDSTPSAINFD